MFSAFSAVKERVGLRRALGVGFVRVVSRVVLRAALLGTGDALLQGSRSKDHCSRPVWSTCHIGRGRRLLQGGRLDIGSAVCYLGDMRIDGIGQHMRLLWESIN